MLRTFSDNPTCRHIVFGGCHDAGYLLNLEQFKHNELKAGRITLLETTPAFRGFADLSHFRRARFEQVFKSEPLPESTPSAFAPNANPLVPANAAPAVQSPGLLRKTTNPSPKPAVSSPAPETPPLSVTGPPAETNGGSWATIGKTGATTNGNISIAPSNKMNKKKKYAYYNKEGQRLDEPLPSRDATAAAALDERMKRTGKKMCNHWHLGGHCENGKFCQFQHEPKLTTAELNALRYKTRSLACKDRYCTNIDCCKLRSAYSQRLRVSALLPNLY